MRRLPLILATFLLIGLSYCLFLAEPTQAQALNADPKTESVTVSAAVPDYFPPTTPLLISPEDGAITTTGYTTFVWQGSSDVNGIKEYKLFLDGELYLDYLPIYSVTTDDYELEYDTINQVYYLTLKNRLDDGLHTWKVRANDIFSNSADSATWSFTIDTQAPNFVLTQVGEHSTSISAQDLSTVPTEPIVLTNNEPQLLGQGETNSTVELMVTIPGDPTQFFSNTTDVNGNWGEKLGILPREIVIQLDFTITDSAGLISVLNGVEILIRQKTITYPPTSPTPTSTTTVSPEPGASPLPSPLISIPLTPPIEIAHEIIQESFEHLPQPLKNLIAAIPASTRGYLTAKSRQLAPILAPLILLLVGLLAPLAILKRFGRRLSPHLLWRGLQALHLLPSGLPAAPPQGLVYDSTDQTPLAYAELLISTLLPVVIHNLFDTSCAALSSKKQLTLLVQDYFRWKPRSPNNYKASKVLLY